MMRSVGKLPVVVQRGPAIGELLAGWAWPPSSAGGSGSPMPTPSHVRMVLVGKVNRDIVSAVTCTVVAEAVGEDAKLITGRGQVGAPGLCGRRRRGGPVIVINYWPGPDRRWWQSAGGRTGQAFTSIPTRWPPPGHSHRRRELVS